MSDKYLFSPVSEVEYRSTLGTAFWVGGDSAADYLLHPVFLHFSLLCLAVLAVLDYGAVSGPAIGWQVPLIWLAVALAGLVGAVLLTALLASLPRRVIGRRRFTPLILLPIVALAEVVRASVMVALQVSGWPPLPELLADFTRNVIIVLILDAMHALYVVPLHPLARTNAEPDRQTQVIPEDEDETLHEEAVPAPRAATPEITIADRRYVVSELLWIRTEDHYLNVVSAGGRSLLRAKLSDLHMLQDGKIGMQVNRSQWVAFAAIETVQDDTGGQVTLRLITGDDVTVARSRRIMFRQMMQAWRQQRSS